MIQWPKHILPSPLIDISEDYQSNVATTQFEHSVRQRQRYKTQANIKNVYWIFDEFQFNFFKSFVFHLLASGSMKFEIELPGLDGMPWTTVSILGGKYSASGESFFYWRVGAALLIESPEIGNAGVTNILLELTGGSESQIICLLESINSYIENFYGHSSEIPPCSLEV